MNLPFCLPEGVVGSATLFAVMLIIGAIGMGIEKILKK